MQTARHLVLLAGFLLLAGLLPACSTNADDKESCPDGQTFRNGRCVPIPGNGGREDVVEPGDPGDPGDPDATNPELDATDSTEPEEISLPETCSPGETSCDGRNAIALCGDDGTWASQPCPSGERCESDQGTPECRTFSGISCTPGEYVACSGPNAVIFCSDAGFSDGPASACPEEAPNCFSFVQGCTEKVCAPEQSFCDGDQVRTCNEGGTDSELVEVCTGGCEAGECIDPCLADFGKDSYVGCDFWTVFLDQFNNLRDERRMAVTVSNAGNDPIEATIYAPDGTQVANATIAASGVQRIDISLPSGLGRGTRIDSNSLWRVEATGPVTIHQFNPPDNVGQFSNDASLLLPSNTWGEDYMVMGWPTQSGNNNNRMTATIIAAEEGETVVTVTASTNIAAGSGQPAVSQGATQEYSLQQGQALHLETATGSRDLTGTRIRSSQPVGVFSGHQCANIPHGTSYCDHVEQQLFPIQTWGNEYAVAKLFPRGTEDDVIRVVALEAGTILQSDPIIQGLDGRTLGAGEVIQVSTRQDFILRANRPISVGQFMVGSGFGCPSFGTSGCRIPRTCGNSGIGDPSFLINKATSQFLSEFVFYVPGQYRENYISVISNRASEVRLNGSPIGPPAAQIPGTTWGVWRQSVPEGVNRLSSTNPAGLYVYGYDCDVSYAYPGGADLSGD